MKAVGHAFLVHIAMRVGINVLQNFYFPPLASTVHTGLRKIKHSKVGLLLPHQQFMLQNFSICFPAFFFSRAVIARYMADGCL